MTPAKFVEFFSEVKNDEASINRLVSPGWAGFFYGSRFFGRPHWSAHSFYPDQNVLQLLESINRALVDPFKNHMDRPDPCASCSFFSSAYAFWDRHILLDSPESPTKRRAWLSKLGGCFTSSAAVIGIRVKKNNILLTEHFQMGFNSRKTQAQPQCPSRRRIRFPAKTRFYAKPNIMQCNSSFLITDPKGELLRDTSHLLKSRGYEVKVFDLINMEQSFCYNPFRYIRDDKDVLKLVTNLIRNTTPKTAGNIDPFWEKVRKPLFLQALMLYLYHEAPAEEQNFNMVMEMLNSAEVREDDETLH